MDAFACANSIAGDFGYKSCVNSRCFGSESLCVGPKQCAYSNAEETSKIIPLEDVDIHEELGISEKDNLEVAELGIVFNKVVCIQDVDGQLSVCNPPTSDQNEICNPKDGGIYPEFSGSSGVKTQKVLSKCATFPCSEKVQSSEEIPTTPLNSQSSLKSENPAYARSVSLPTTLKLVSALKGGREMQGASLKAKMNVKWAPDVYDPPTTSMSHTVKNHHQRPKSKKKDHHKHKHKGKSSRGCGNEKKYMTRSSSSNITYPLPLRLQAVSDRVLLDGFVQSSAEVLDYAVSGQESKCGSSFLMESLAKVQFSIAEAS